jgi:hypothetical protein
MAIIYTYPTKTTLATSDLILMSDSADGNKTKNTTVASIKDAIDVVDSITATLPLEATSATGDVTISSRAYGGGATTGFVPSGGTAGNYLDGAGTWSTIDLTTDVNGILRTQNGGLGVGTFQDGDLVYYDGTRFASLATSGVTNNYVLTAVSGVPTWALNPSGGSGPGTGTQYNLPIWSTTSTLGDSLITQDNVGGLATALTIGSNVASFSTTAGVGSVFATQVSINGYSGVFGGKLKLGSPDGATPVTIEGPANGGAAYTLKLPSSAPNNNQILEYTTSGNLGWTNTPAASGTYTLQAEAKVGTSLPLKLDASSGSDSTVSLTEGTNITLTRNSSSQITIASSGSAGGGISPFPIYQASHSVAVGGQTIIRQSVCETAGTYSRLEYFSVGASSNTVYFAIYTGTITAAGSAVKRLEGYNATSSAGINVINLSGSYNFTAGQDIVIIVSADDTFSMAGSTALLDHADICRGTASYTNSFPAALDILIDGITSPVTTGVCTHIY